MRKIICHLCTLIVLLFSFVHPSPVWADDPITHPLRVGIFANKPMCYLDEQGEPAGIFVETIQYIAEKEEWRLEFVEGSWSDQRQRLEKGDLDILMAMAVTEERKKIYTFNDVDVFSNWAEIYVRPESRISSFLDLKGKRVASLDKAVFTTGPEGILSLNERFHLDAQVIPVNSYEAAMATVRDGRAEAAVSNRMAGAQYAKKYGLIKSGIVFCPVSVRFSLNQESSLTPLLVAAIDKHLNDLRADHHSVYHQAIAAALGGGGAKDFWPSWFFYTTLVLAIVVTGMLFFLFVLRLQVKKKTRELIGLNSRLAEKMAAQEKTTRELKESEERFRSLADSMSQLVWTAAPNGRVDYANARMRQAITALHGLKKMIHPDDFNQTGRGWAKAVATGQPYRMEHRLAHPDNTYHWYLTLGVPSLNQEGQVSKWYGTSTDINELRLAQESLQEKQELLDEVQELTRLGGWNLDVDSGVMTWTKGTYRIHDVSPDQTPAAIINDIVFYSPLDQEKLDAAMQTAISQGVPFDLELDLMTPKGQSRRVRMSGKVKQRDNKVTHVFGMIMDISAERQREEELQQANEELRVINRVITTSATATGVKDLLTKMLDETLTLTNLEGGGICLIEEDDTLVPVVHRQPSGSASMVPTPQKVKVGNCLCGECARSQKAFILESWQEVQTFPRCELQRGEDIHYYVAFPLSVGSRRLGVLCLFSRIEKQLSARQLGLLESVSIQIAIGLDNAQMFAQSSIQAATLEEKVLERTNDLQKSRQAMQLLLEDMAEAQEKMQRLNKQFVGRELRMRELKEEIERLKGGAL